jgi:hypothetical protein
MMAMMNMGLAKSLEVDFFLFEVFCRVFVTTIWAIHILSRAEVSQYMHMTITEEAREFGSWHPNFPQF